MKTLIAFAYIASLTLFIGMWAGSFAVVGISLLVMLASIWLAFLLPWEGDIK